MTELSKNARVAGLLYILASIFGVVRLIYIPSKLFVHGNPAATASNIAAHELLFRFGILSDLLGATLWLFVTLALYRLFKGVDHTLATLIVVLGSLLAVPIFFFNTVNDAAALLFARGTDYLSVFTQPQRDAFVRLFLDLHFQAVLANEMFWGLWLIPLGLLVCRSDFLPRVLGIWLIIACFAYLTLSFTGILFPQYLDRVDRIASPINLAEVAFMLWLTIVGAREQRTATRAKASA